MIIHPFEPIYSSNSEILILGSFPSVKSREKSFYYAHLQNRFWRLISTICENKLPGTIEEKKNLIIKNNLAIWDVVKSCEINGSADISIKNIELYDVNGLVAKTKIKKIIFNGKKASELYFKYNKKINNIEYVTLPSTSPANAKYSFDRLYNIWKNEFKESRENK